MNYRPLPKFFSTRASKSLAESIASAYGAELSQVDVQQFKDGEFSISATDTVRGSHVFIIGSTFQPSDNLMELLMLIDLMRRASAGEITVVVPYFGWARQDRKDKARVPITAKLVADLITKAGARRIVTMDLHADQIQGFFEIPLDHVYASTLYMDHVKKRFDVHRLCVVSPDAGGAKRAEGYAKALGTDLVICHKRRSRPNEIAEMRVFGDVSGKDVVIFDDIIDTAGTIAGAADKLKALGADTITVYVTHPVLSGDAYANIDRSAIEKLWVTDSIPLKKSSPKISVVSCSVLFSKVLRSVHNYESVSDQNRLA